jgi:hypothetical protein
VALAVLDLAALLMVMGIVATSTAPSTILAAGMHLLVVATAIAAIRLFPGAKEHPGYKTLSFLAGFFCLFTPFLGALAGGWLVIGMLFPATRRELGDRFVIGNPLNGSSTPIHPSVAPVSEPLAVSIANGQTSGLRLAVPLIRGRRRRSTVAILRALTDQQDARTQLYSQSALATMLETSDWEVSNLRRMVAVSRDTAAMERLAAELARNVEIGLVTSSESEIVGEALGLYEELAVRHPADPAYLFGKGICLIRLGRLDEVPDIYGRLCSLANAAIFADRLELSYFAAIGNWKRAAAAVERIAKDGNRIALPLESRAFWLMEKGT